MVADPILNEDFQRQCSRRSIPGTEAERNRYLFRIRKSGKLKQAGIITSKRTTFGWEQMDPFLFASEIAWRRVSDLYADASLDEILCDPRLAEKFDEIAASCANGFSPLEYRWAALKLRKEGSNGRKRAERMKPEGLGLKMFTEEDLFPFKKRRLRDCEPSPGIYAICQKDLGFLYVGETSNLNAQSWIAIGREREKSLAIRPARSVETSNRGSSTCNDFRRSAGTSESIAQMASSSLEFQ